MEENKLINKMIFCKGSKIKRSLIFLKDILKTGTKSKIIKKIKYKVIIK